MSKKIKAFILVLVGLVLINIGTQRFYGRFDLTTDKRYTLSEVSTSILDKIDGSLYITVYLEGDFPAEFKRLQIETQQFLEELRAENSSIVIRFENPDDIREELVKKGMIPSQLTVEEDGQLSQAIIFPWAEVEYQNRGSIVSLLPQSIVASQEEQLQNAVESLEFSFVDAINNIVKKKRKRVAVITGNGQLEDRYLYSFLSEVAKKNSLAKFTLDSVASNPQRTLQDLSTFDLAIIAKPTQKFTEEEKFTLDQYITNGGKTLWMIDNVQADMDSLLASGRMLAYPRDLNLTDLLFSYGVRINTSLIQDLYAAKIPLSTGNVGNQPQFQNLPWFYHPVVNGNPNHPITKNVSPVRMQFVTQIDTLKNTIQKTPLLVSSLLTKKTGTPNFIELQSIANEPKEEEYKGSYQLFGVLLEGDFNSAYKSRIKPYNTPLFKGQSTPNKMIVISDGDVGRNQLLKGKPHDLSTDKWTNEQFGNKDLLINAVDYLLDDSGLITLRNKNLQINNLDKQRAFKERTYWQFLNVVLPLLLLFGFGFVLNYLRRKKYS
ncbi:gliding motility-associated ABC transporter substrate-binding protein GldG [Flavobacteriaceae bacterium S356]|uniref:Gliding motility-associated ABC transporter substrate-binding protein GldG n=1 Tax=Asprobacillus argus TaxID=3076534 RepID=A0ABU3LIK7_9FLAO|nr:gliding motility-associated ABC transporter substrate-binding protein GldG [Flavobacteriaceae bacterium S356]